jgi:hypothetical protein
MTANASRAALMGSGVLAALTSPQIETGKASCERTVSDIGHRVSFALPRIAEVLRLGLGQSGGRLPCNAEPFGVNYRHEPRLGSRFS